MIINTPSSLVEIRSISEESLGFRAGPARMSVVMPCLNEAETLAACIRKARQWLDEASVIGEIIIADNGSTDGFSGDCFRVGSTGR